MSSAENDTHTGRLIWISSDVIEMLNSRSVMSDPAAFAAATVFDAWHQAPADPAEAIAAALTAQHVPPWTAEAFADAAIAALGLPSGVSRDATQPTNES